MLSEFISLIFPDYCAGCRDVLEKNEKQLCTNCRFNLPLTDFHLNSADNVLAKRLWGRVKLAHSLSYLKFVKGGIVQEIIHGLKYKGEKELGIILGNWYGSQLSETGYENAFDIIIPVPLHPDRLKRRGYNQSDLFGQGLSVPLNLEFNPDILTRVINTGTQTNKSKINRWKNVETAFEVKNGQYLENKRVLIVDDVITTGATIEGCVNALLPFGFKEMSMASIAFAE